jgi:rubrerythrin
MIDVTRQDAPEQGDAVDFHAAGDRTKGEFRCSGCGYGVAIVATLPNCPMCGGDTWERGPWRPMTRAQVPQ